MLVELRSAIFGYGNQPVVQVEKLHLHGGRCLGIFGPNGIGKTTLVRGLIGLLLPIQGEILRRSDTRIAYLPQQRRHLNWPMTGLDAASLATSSRRPMGWMFGPNQIRTEMEKLGVADLAHRSFSKLSGGQQQRLLLAGALADRPHLLVLDEPTDGLDLQSCAALFDILRQQISMGLCITVVSHDVQHLLKLADQIAWLQPAALARNPSRVELLSPSDFSQCLIQSQRG